MKKYPKHYRPDPNEWVPHTTKMQWQCCDCGLVHNVEFRLKTLEVRMTRNYKETKKVRTKIKNMEKENLVPLSDRQKRYDALCVDMVQNGGFTEKQTAWLINLLEQYLPLF